MKKVIPAILNCSKNGLLILALLLSLFLILPLFGLPGRWYQLALVKSASMEPILPVGSLAVYREDDLYRPDEIIAYHYEQSGKEELVIHRLKEKIISTDGTVSYLTAGDAGSAALPQIVMADQVEGKLIAVLPKLGYVVGFLQSRLGSALLMFSLLVLLLLSQWGTVSEKH